MRIFVPALMIAAALLSACSDSGSSNNSTPGGFIREFDPTQKPADAVPAEYAQQVLQSLRQMRQYLPAEPAIFNSVITAGDVKAITDESPERKQALQKLSLEGRRLLDDIKSQCAIKDATKTDTGEVRQGGETVRALAASIEGDSCLYTLKRNETASLTYDQIQSDKDAESAAITARINTKSEVAHEVKDFRTMALSGISGFSAVVENAGQIQVTKKRNVVTQNLRLAGTGRASLHLANGDVIAGPVKTEASGTEKSVDVRILFEGRAPNGALRLVILQKTGQEAQAFLNGEKIDTQVWKELGLELPIPLPILN